MGITRKDVQKYLWVFLGFWMRLCCTFAREHPLASLVFVIILILYVFLSTIFWFLIYSFPVALIAAVTIKIKYFPERPKDAGGAENRKNADLKSSPSGKIKLAGDDEKKKKAIGRAQSVRRRKSKKDFPPYVEEEGGSILAGFNEHEMVDKSPVTEENMKDIREVVEVRSVSDKAAECSSSSDASQSLCVEGVSKAWRKSFRVMDESENEMTDSNSENEEGMRRERKKKGVQWNQEDLSEMERNKRLESLMARRRARRLVSLHVRRTLMNIGSDDPPMAIVIPRTTNAGSSNPFSPTPGSAPSVLLPAHNPFDLPYDQHEEKPNLRGGSFHQDFMVPNQDFMFCRHESFTLGPSFNEDFNSRFPHRFKFFERPEGYRKRTPLVNKEDAADRVIEQVLVEEAEELNQESTSDVKEQASAHPEEDGSEVQIKSVLIEDIDDRTSSSSSEEDDEPFYRIDKDAILKSLTTTPSSSRNIVVDNQESLNPGPSMSQKARMEEHYYYANGAMLPTPSHSVASDLQVEVSEIGSPPRSVDGASSLEEEISVYNRELEKDTASGNECTLLASSRPSRLDENESRSREVRDVTEQDLVKSGFSNINPTLHTPPERVIQQDPVDSTSFADSHAYKSGERSASIAKNDIIELVKRNSHAKIDGELAISEASESPADLEASVPPEPVFEQAHVASAPSLIGEVENDTSNLDQEARVEVQDANVHKVENETSNLLLNDHMAQDSFSPAEADKNGENSMSIEKNDVREVTQDRAVEPPSERGFSVANQSGHAPQTTLLILESGDEHVPDVPSSSTSPKSQPMFSMNQDSSSSFVSKIHYEDQQYGFAERRDEDLGSSMVNQSSDDPESVAEQISTSSSSSSSSSTSMSQTKFSLDLASSNWDQEPQMEVPQSQNQIAETTHQVTYDISNPTTSHESLQLLADIPTVHHQEREILNIDSTKEIEGLPELETTAPRSESYDHDKFSEETGNSSYDLDKSSEEIGNNHMIPLVIHEDTQNKDSIAETKGLPKLETSAHHSEPHDREKYSEETRNNHMIPLVIHEDTQNKDSVAEIEGLPELETSAHHSEPHDCEKYSEKTSTSNHTNASVIPEEVLKIDYIEKTEGLPKLEMTTHRLESNDHKYSSKETSSDNHHTNAPVIQKEIQNTNSIKEAGGPPELEMTKGDLPCLNEERGPQGPSMAENKEAKMIEGAAHLKETVQKPVAKETSTNNHTNVASVIPEDIFKIDCTEETERLPKLEITTNHLESNNHEKSSNETSNDNHTNASVMVEGAAHLEGTIQKPVAEETSTSNHTNAVSVIPEEILKIDCTKETERLPKSEMTTNRLESNDHEKSSNETSSDNHTNASVMVEGTAHLEGTVQKGVAEETSTSNHTNAASVIPTEILKIDCTKETERPPKPEMTTNRLEPNDHEKSSNKINSDNHTNAFVMTEGETHLEGKVHKPIAEETSTSNHTNAASVISEVILKIDCTEEAERLPKPEMTTNRLEPNYHEKSSNETNIDNHTNASVMTGGATHIEGTVHKPIAEEISTSNHTNAASVTSEAILKIDCTEEAERLPKLEMTTNRLEPNDHEKSSNETNSDNHTNASLIQPGAAVKSDVNNVVQSECRSFSVNEVSNFDVSKAVNEKSNSTHRLELNDHEKSSNETSSDNHTNASVIQPVAAVKSDVNNVVESEPRSFIVNEVSNFDVSKAVNEKSDSTHHLESNDHEKSSNETSSDNHTNASVIHPVAAVKSLDVNNVVESEPRSFIVNEVNNFDVSKVVNEKSDSTHRLESNDHEKSSNEPSSDTHTNASIIQPVAAVKSDVNNVVESEPRSFIVNEVSNFDVSKDVNEKSDSTHRLESNDHEKSSNETSSDNHTNASVIPPVAAVRSSDVNDVVESEPRSFIVNEVSNFDVSKAVNEKSDSTHRLESNDHDKSSNETSSDNHTNAFVTQPVAAVKSNVNNVVESESISFTVNEVGNFDVSKAVNEKSDSTHSANSIEREATPDLSQKPIENEREIPNLIIVNNDNDKAPSFQGSHEGESSRGLPSHDFVTKQPQTSQSVHPSKGQDPEGEHWIQNEADAATSTSRGDAGKDHGSQDSEKPMNSENASDHQKANETNIGSGERDHSNTNLKD